MAGSLGDLFATVGARIEGFEKAMGTVSQRLAAVDRDAQRTMAGFEKIGDRMTEIGTRLSIAITAPLAAVGIGAGKMAADFELGMRKVTSLLGDATENEFKNLSKATLELSRTLGIDAVKATDALYEAISAGVPKENAIAFLGVAAQAAIAGVTDTKVAVDGLTNIINSYGLETSKAAVVSDAMFQAVNIGKFTFEQLASSVGLASGTAAKLGVSFQELLAAGATITKQGFTIAEAMTSIQSAMVAIITPNKQMNELFAQMGVKSGEALLKTKGLEGSLQALQVATKGSNQQFAESLGRVEALRAALALTGKNAGDAAKDFESITNSAGAAARAFQEIDKSTSRQFERLTAELKVSAIELGNSLLPAVNNLLRAMQPLMESLKSVVDWFTKLSPTTQTVVLSIAAMTAVLGPLAIIVGQVISGISAINAAFMAAFGIMTQAGAAFATLGGAIGNIVTAINTGMVGALTAGEAALLRFGAAGIAIGTVFLAFSQLSTAKDNISRVVEAATTLAETLGILKTKTEEATGASKDHAVVLADGKTRMEEVSVIGTALSIAFDKAAEAGKALSRVDWWERIKEAIGPIGQLNFALRNLADNLDKLTATFKSSTQWQREAEDQTKKQITRLTEFNQKVYGADISSQALNASLAQSRATLGGVTTETDKATKAWDEYQKKHQQMLGPLTLEQAIMAEQAKEMTQQTQAWIKQLADLPAKAETFIQKLSKSAQESFNLKTILQDLNETMGLPNLRMASLQMEQMAIAAATAKKGISDFKKSFDEMVQSWSRVHPLFGIDLGFPPELPKRVKETSQWLQQISTIMTDMSRNIAGGIFDLFKPSKKNEALDQEAAKLRESLAERGAEWEKYQADIAVKLDALREKHADELAKEEADVRKSLEEKRVSYEKYESDILAKIDVVREKHAAALAGEIDDLMAGQRKEELEYEKFAQNVEAKLAELPRKYQENLDKELDALKRSKADAIEAYDEFVADANLRLSRIGQDLGETIEDQTRSTNRRLEDENKDYTRDVMDLNGDIAEAEKKGDKKRVAELRETLRRREQDHSISIRRMQEDLAEQVDDARRQAERQTADLKSQLERRAADHKEFLAKNADAEAAARTKSAASLAADEKELRDSLAARAGELVAYRASVQEKIEAATKLHAVQLETEERDLRDSLIERGNEWAAYQREAAEKLEDFRIAQARELEKQEADLRDALADKLADWEDYRLGVMAQLEKLEADHETWAGRLAGAFKNALSEMGQAVARFGLESMTKGLFKWFGELLSDWFPSIASALGKVFGGVFGGVGSAAGSAAGGAAGSAGSLGGALVSSGIMGTIGAVGAAIGAVSGVIGNFQMKGMNDSLSLIEESTRFTAIATIGPSGIIDTLRTFLPPVKDFAVDGFYGVFMPAFASLMSTTEEIRDTLTSTISDALWSIYDAITLPTQQFSPAMALPGAGGVSITVNNPTFLGPGDMDAFIGLIETRLREITGNVI